MRTWSGELAPLEAGVGKVQPLDLVVQLGRQRRFGGWGDPEWTVLHHSKLCALLWLIAGYPASEVVYVLIHDDHEGVMGGDMPAPVKRRLRELSEGVDPIGKLEASIDERIRERLKLPEPSVEVLARIKVVDQAALVMEAMVFGPPGCIDEVSKRVPKEREEEIWHLVSAAGGWDALAARGRRG
jgi:hypothetical protein